MYKSPGTQIYSCQHKEMKTMYLKSRMFAHTHTHNTKNQIKEGNSFFYFTESRTIYFLDQSTDENLICWLKVILKYISMFVRFLKKISRMNKAYFNPPKADMHR